MNIFLTCVFTIILGEGQCFSAMAAVHDNLDNNVVHDNECEQRVKKRKRKEETWKRNVKKYNRNLGKSYVTVKGKITSEKVFTNDDCRCPKKCFNKITEESRKKCFDGFGKWEISQFKMHIYVV